MNNETPAGIARAGVFAFRLRGSKRGEIPVGAGRASRDAPKLDLRRFGHLIRFFKSTVSINKRTLARPGPLDAGDTMTSIETAQTQRASRRFIQSAMQVPLLEPEREQFLARAWRDNRDEVALHELTTAYMRLVVSMAARFRTYGLPMADLVQEGCVGLMQAAARFEPEREVRFSTYATWWIRSSIQDYILRNWSIVRTGTTAAQKSLFFNLRRLRALIADGAQPQLTPEQRGQIAQKLNVNVTDVESMESRLSAADRSLNAPMGEASEAEWQDSLADERQIPEEAVMDHRDRTRCSELLREAMDVLNEREVVIIRERRLTEDSVTLETLGGRLGISKERVRQIEHQAMRKLRKALVERVGDPVEAGLVSPDAVSASVE